MITITTTSELAGAGRVPVVPFAIMLSDGRELLVDEVFRIFPGRRIVGSAMWCGKHVLAKLFVDRSRSEQDCAAERQGLAALREANIATPAVLTGLSMQSGGHALLIAFLENAQPINSLAPAAVSAVLPDAFVLLAGMHAKGLRHTDPHLGNFLLCADRMHVVDGDAVLAGAQGRALSGGEASENLALLVAQLPVQVRRRDLSNLLQCYANEVSPLVLDTAQLDHDIATAIQRRERTYLRKCMRDCSEFQVTRSATRFCAVAREHAHEFAQLLAQPDDWIASGEMLKDGRTCTVVKVRVAGSDLVIKRYNIKSTGHWLSRLLRPSRAARSWAEGHRLTMWGIATPRPLAFIEERWGPLRRRAWLIVPWCPGMPLHDTLDRHTSPEERMPVLLAVRELFANLRDGLLVHGDMKASNLLWHDGLLTMIDLDAMHHESSIARWRRSARKDRARLLRNWEDSDPVWQALNRLLPLP